MQNPKSLDGLVLKMTSSYTLIFILSSGITGITSSSSHRSDLGHSSRLQFSLATPVVGNMFGECGLRFGAWGTVFFGGDSQEKPGVGAEN